MTNRRLASCGVLTPAECQSANPIEIVFYVRSANKTWNIYSYRDFREYFQANRGATSRWGDLKVTLTDNSVSVTQTKEPAFEIIDPDEVRKFYDFIDKNLDMLEARVEKEGPPYEPTVPMFVSRNFGDFDVLPENIL